MKKMIVAVLALVGTLALADAPRKYTNAEVLVHVLNSKQFGEYLGKEKAISGAQLTDVSVKHAKEDRYEVYFTYEADRLGLKGGQTVPCNFSAAVAVKYGTKFVKPGSPLTVASAELLAPSFSEVICPEATPRRQ